MAKFLKGLFLILLALGAVAFIWEAPHPFQVYRSQPLPEFDVTTLDGKSINTKEWNNFRPRAYNVFASWCGPCKEELPQIKLLNEAIPVYGIAVQDSPANIRKMLQREGNPFTDVAMDTQNFTGLILGVRGLPTTIVIDKYGQIAEVYEGPIRPEAFTDEVKPMIEGLHGR